MFDKLAEKSKDKTFMLVKQWKKKDYSTSITTTICRVVGNLLIFVLAGVMAIYSIFSLAIFNNNRVAAIGGAIIVVAIVDVMVGNIMIASKKKNFD